MIYDCQHRLENAIADLDAQIVCSFFLSYCIEYYCYEHSKATIPATDTEALESEIYKNAKKALADGTTLLGSFDQL